MSISARDNVGAQQMFLLPSKQVSLAQVTKNLPAMQETWVQSLDWDDALDKGMAPHSSIHAWRIPWTGGWWATFHGVAKSVTRLSD